MNESEEGSVQIAERQKISAPARRRSGPNGRLSRSLRSVAERILDGRRMRKDAPRRQQAEFGKLDRDPVALIEESSKGRVAQLVQLRYGRMLESPFAFYRGTALLQAHDLRATVRTKLVTQICGDCHLMNFGGFATPERNLLFDINDFDETHPGPWEWDLKRLVASFTIAARHLGHSKRTAEECSYEAAKSYQTAMTGLAQSSELDIWYQQFTLNSLLETTKSDVARKTLKRVIAMAQRRTHEELLPKIAERTDAGWTIRDRPPSIFHVFGETTLIDKSDDWMRHPDWEAASKKVYEEYLGTLPPERRNLLRRFHIQDTAFKVVGVGSVGTRCMIALMIDDRQTPLFLQLKEAGPSVIASYVKEKTGFHHNGQRVVEGQRLMQAASDPFLGWATGVFGRQFYFRQLRDMKVAASLETYDAEMITEYAKTCGQVLARAHAKGSGNAPEISGYIGKSDSLCMALVAYAAAYADQAERDYDVFRAACRNGSLTARTDAEFAQDLAIT